MRNHFLTALIQLFKIENNPVTIQAIDKMTKHISENQYADFISECGNAGQFKRPLEVIKSVSDRYMDEIKSELFKDVEADAKTLEKKLEAYFIQVEEMFRPSSPVYNPEYATKLKTPSELIKIAKISTNDYWNDKDVYLIKKIDLSTLYGLYNDPYKQMWEAISKEMQNAITKKYLIGDRKQIESKSGALDNLEIKRIGK